jgi:hypothetical protein
MRGDPRFFDLDDRLKELSAKGDDLERLKGIISPLLQEYRLLSPSKGAGIRWHDWRWSTVSKCGTTVCSLLPLSASSSASPSQGKIRRKARIPNGRLFGVQMRRDARGFADL